MAKSEQINIEPGILNDLRRAYSIFRAGLREILDPIDKCASWWDNFKDGLSYQRYKIRAAKTRKSLTLEEDSWEYDKCRAIFKRKDGVHIALVIPKNYNPKYVYARTD